MILGGIGVRIALANGLDRLPVGKIGEQKLPPPLFRDFGALVLFGVKLGEFHEE